MKEGRNIMREGRTLMKVGKKIMKEEDKDSVKTVRRFLWEQPVGRKAELRE